MKDDIQTARVLNPDSLLKDKLMVKFGHQLADLGCGGAGYFTLPAARLVGTKGKVYAVDILKSSLDGVTSKAKIENLMNIETVWSNLEQVGATKISENTVDEALLINILFQSRQNTNFLQEAKRLMKSGGKLLVIDWKVEPTPFGPPLQNRMTPEAIRALGEGVGFKVQEQFEAGPYHYGLILVKQ